jgi:hypothetical protein
MARLTKDNLFDAARQYLDTDDLNFPDGLLDTLLQRVWFQAVSMERDWRFFQRQGTAPVVAGDPTVPFSFAPPAAAAMPSTRLINVQLSSTGDHLPWWEYTTALFNWGQDRGTPFAYSELNEGTQRVIRLWPTPGADDTLVVDFYAEPVYADSTASTFSDLPPEFDSALLEGLLSDMYNREEDPDLGDMHRQMFLEQMGSIRNRWRYTMDTPLVYAGLARADGLDPGGFDAMGRMTAPSRQR